MISKSITQSSIWKILQKKKKKKNFWKKKSSTGESLTQKTIHKEKIDVKVFITFSSADLIPSKWPYSSYKISCYHLPALFWNRAKDHVTFLNLHPEWKSRILHDKYSLRFIHLHKILKLSPAQIFQLIFLFLDVYWRIPLFSFLFFYFPFEK